MTRIVNEERDGRMMPVDKDPYNPAPQHAELAPLVGVHPYPDGKRVLLVTETGEKIIHEIGDSKRHPRAHQAYEEFMKRK